MAIDDEVLSALKELISEIRAKGGVPGTGETGKSRAELEKEGKSPEEKIEAMREEAKVMQQMADNYKKLGTSQQARSIAQEQTLRAKQQELEAQKAEIRLGVDLSKDAVKRLEAAQKEVDLHEEKLAVVNKTNDAFTEGVAAAGSLGQAMGAMAGAGVGAHPLFNVTNLGNVWKSFRGGSNSIRAFGTNLIKAGIGAFINSMLNLIFVMNESESAFRKATGGSASLSREMTQGYERTRAYTVGVKENEQAWTSLHGTFTDFTMTSASTRAQLGDTVAVLSRLGISAEASSKAMQSLTISFGENAQSVSQALLELEAYAEDLGVAPKQLVEQFGQMGNRLAKLGSDGVKAFKDLARVSKITGMEIGKLMSMVEKFDTFEGAAKQAGMLNAALGGNFVNAMDLMMSTDPADRFMQIRDAIMDTGMSFDDMSYYQRLFYTEAAGLEDVSDLAALMRGDMDALSGGLNQTSADYAATADRARKMATFQERLNAMFMKFIPILYPVMDAIERVLSYYEDNTDALIRGEGPLGGFILAMKKLGKVIKFVGNNWEWMVALWAVFKFGPLLKNITLMTGKLFGLGTAEKVVGTSGGTAAPGTYAFAAGVAAIGFAIGAAAAGLSLLISSFADLEGVGWGTVFKGITAVAGSVAILAIALAALANPASTAGAGVLLAIGASIGLAAVGLSALVGVFKKDKDNMEDMATVFEAYGSIREGALEGGVQAFENMKSAVNQMNSKSLSNLAVAAPKIFATAASATPATATGGSRQVPVDNVITIELEGEQIANISKRTIGTTTKNALGGQ